jgi:hypothetical protein
MKSSENVLGSVPIRDVSYFLMLVCFLVQMASAAHFRVLIQPGRSKLLCRAEKEVGTGWLLIAT